MHDQTTVFSPARFFLLTLAFVTAAVLAVSLQDMLPPVRILLTDKPTVPTLLSGFLPSPFDTRAADVFSCTAGIAAEMLVWFCGGLTPYAAVVFYPAAVYRGFCFGVTVSMQSVSGSSVLNGADTVSFAGFILVTVVLFLFASGVCRGNPVSRRISSAGSFCRYGARFLICAGAAFWITVLCSRLPAVFL